MEVKKAIEIIEELGIDCRGYPSLKKAVDVLLEYTKAQLSQEDATKNTTADLQPTCNQLATDCISRQAAIDAPDCINGAEEVLRALPPAQPERKPGHWIEMGVNADKTHNIVCPRCGAGYKTRGHARSIATKAKWKFCPNCGAKMGVAE